MVAKYCAGVAAIIGAATVFAFVPEPTAATYWLATGVGLAAGAGGWCLGALPYWLTGRHSDSKD